MAEFGSAEALGGFLRYFNTIQGTLEDGRLSALRGKGSEERWAAGASLLLSVKESADSLLRLAELGKARDCYVIARTVFETVVNCCFILASDEEVAQRARRHAEQKTFRDLHRELTISGKTLVARTAGRSEDLAEDTSLKEALAEFTSQKGHEITAWTSESLVQRIEAVGAAYGEDVQMELQFALFGVYRHASEIIHGTLFGALFSLGFTTPGGPPASMEDLAKHRLELLSLVLLMAGMAISAMIAVLAFELKDRTLLERAAEAHKELGQAGWIPKSQ